MRRKENELENAAISIQDREDIKNRIPTWQDVFLHADTMTKRVLVNKLVERIDVNKTEVIVRFKVTVNGVNSNDLELI